MRGIGLSVFLGLLVLSGCSDSRDADGSRPALVDPGDGEWAPVPRDRVAAECGLDPDLLEAADQQIQRPWAIVRHGKLCHEYYPSGSEQITEIFSTTKTLSALVTGMVAWETRDIERTGRKTGPVSDTDRVDHWLDDFTFNPDARIANVLAMNGHNPDLSYGNRLFSYDLDGTVQINRLSDVLNTAIAQDPDRLGANLEEFTQRFLFEPLGMRSSVWSGGAPDKTFAFSWNATVRDMARLGLLILNGGEWNGRRLLSEEWIYKMTHPAFEDASRQYGYLTWLATRTPSFFFGECAPAALWNEYPHGLSEAPDCLEPAGCDQEFDVGVWSALGLFGQIITGHPGLDMVVIAKDIGDDASAAGAWAFARPALVAMDERFQGDEEAFCAEYAASRYAPDLF